MQSFIVCRHMTRHIILGPYFTSMNCVGVIWTQKGTKKMVQAKGPTVIELSDAAAGVPLVLADSVKIQPGSHLMVPLE